MSRKKRTLLGNRGRIAAEDAPTMPSLPPEEAETDGPDDAPARPASDAETAPTADAPLPLAAWATPPVLDTDEAPRPASGFVPEPTPTPTAPLDPDLAMLGRRIGQWSVKDVLGSNQGCVLVRARHHQSKRIRATLKVLHDEDAATRQRLVREGEVLFPLDHPSIIGVRNVMLHHDPPFLEFAQLRGERLDSLLQRRRTLFMAEALDLVEQLLATLDYLHGRRVYHLDIRPSNLVIRPDGVITLIGFSYAVEHGPDAPAGTEARSELPHTALPYVPPEWPEQGPAHADLYAVGALLYRLLTGEQPFGVPARGGALTTAAVLHQKSRTPFLDPGERFQDDLRSVVRHLTTREPAGRLAVAGDALSRLQAVERSYAS
jgi:serine/threonine protein kinase